MVSTNQVIEIAKTVIYTLKNEINEVITGENDPIFDTEGLSIYLRVTQNWVYKHSNI